MKIVEKHSETVKHDEEKETVEKRKKEMDWHW